MIITSYKLFEKLTVREEKDKKYIYDQKKYLSKSEIDRLPDHIKKGIIRRRKERGSYNDADVKRGV